MGVFSLPRLAPVLIRNAFLGLESDSDRERRKPRAMVSIGSKNALRSPALAPAIGLKR